MPAVHDPGISAIYVAASEGDAGKSTIALGILHRLTATLAKVGAARPITRLGEAREYILELLLAHSAAVVANRHDPAQMTGVAEALRKFAPQCYVVSEEPVLIAPSVAITAIQAQAG